MAAAAVAAYAIPAAGLWAALGLLGNALPVAEAALLLAAGYAACYGLAETAGSWRLAAPGSSWQVPQAAVLGVRRRRRLLVWGSILGPGFATRNPYAGFWVLPPAVAAMGSIPAGIAVAAAVGAAHGTARALALVRDARGACTADHLQLVLKSLRWRTADGAALLVIAGAAAVTFAYHW